MLLSLQYFNKQMPTLSIKVVSTTQARPNKKQKSSETNETFKGNELKKYFRYMYDSILIAQIQQLNELQWKAGLIEGKYPLTITRN